MLLDPLEEQLHLPAAAVEFGDGQRGQREVVGEEDKRGAGAGIAELDAAQLVRIVLRGLGAREHDGLVAAQARLLVDRTRVQPAAPEVGLRAYDEEGGAKGKRVQPAIVHVAAVHDVEGAGLGRQLVEHVDIVQLAVGDVDERGDAAAQVHQGVQLHGPLGRPEAGPGEQGQAQVDGGRVERVDGVVEFDAEVLVQVELARGVDQGLGEVGVDAPVPRLVGVGQCVARDRAANAHVVELAPLGAQACLDVAQALPVGQLGEGHAAELVEAGERLDLVMAPVAPDAAPQRVHGEMFHHLGEDEAVGVHALLLRATRLGLQDGNHRQRDSSR